MIGFVGMFISWWMDEEWMVVGLVMLMMGEKY